MACHQKCDLCRDCTTRNPLPQKLLSGYDDIHQRLIAGCAVEAVSPRHRHKEEDSRVVMVADICNNVVY